MPVPLVHVVRSDLQESLHLGDVAVVDGHDRLIAFAGDPDRRAFARSSMKPLQATVSLSLSTFDYSDREVSVMCASHNAEPVHVDAVRAILRRAGVPESALRCPPAYPWDVEALIAAPEKLSVNSDCSGKHAGMLGAACEQGWDLDTYRSPEHPLQARILEAVVLASGTEHVDLGVDGCGLPVHGMALRSMAAIYARLAAPEALGALEPHARRAVDAMAREPYMVAGRGRVDTAVMETIAGVVVKAGAEAMICAALRDRGIGIAVKISDGSARAAGPALIRALALLDAADDEALDRLEPFAEPPVLGGGLAVGRLHARFDLQRP
jgi:L-asparaginase II